MPKSVNVFIFAGQYLRKTISIIIIIIRDKCTKFGKCACHVVLFDTIYICLYCIVAVSKFGWTNLIIIQLIVLDSEVVSINQRRIMIMLSENNNLHILLIMHAASIIYCFTYQNSFDGILSQYNDTEGVPSWTVNLKKKTVTGQCQWSKLM